MRDLRGLSVAELLVATALVSVVLIAGSEAVSKFRSGEKKSAVIETSLVDTQLAAKLLNRDILQAATFSSSTATELKMLPAGGGTAAVVYTVSTEPCPQYGPSANCKVLSRGLNGSASARILELADVKWCVIDTVSIGDCSFLPSGSLALPPAQQGRRVLVEFSLHNANRPGSVKKFIHVFFRQQSGWSGPRPVRTWRIQ